MKDNPKVSDTFMMSDSLLGVLDERALFGDEKLTEGLTVEIISDNSAVLNKDVLQIKKNTSAWEISFKSTPKEVILSSLLSEVSFKIQDTSNSDFFISTNNSRVTSFTAKLDHAGSYICKLVLAID